jgi:hypothetical protein
MPGGPETSLSGVFLGTFWPNVVGLSEMLGLPITALYLLATAFQAATATAVFSATGRWPNLLLVWLGNLWTYPFVLWNPTVA